MTDIPKEIMELMSILKDEWGYVEGDIWRITHKFLADWILGLEKEKADEAESEWLESQITEAQRLGEDPF